MNKNFENIGPSKVDRLTDYELREWFEDVFAELTSSQCEIAVDVLDEIGYIPEPKYNAQMVGNLVDTVEGVINKLYDASQYLEDISSYADDTSRIYSELSGSLSDAIDECLD